MIFASKCGLKKAWIYRLWRKAVKLYFGLWDWDQSFKKSYVHLMHVQRISKGNPFFMKVTNKLHRENCEYVLLLVSCGSFFTSTFYWILCAKDYDSFHEGHIIRRNYYSVYILQRIFQCETAIFQYWLMTNWK